MTMWIKNGDEWCKLDPIQPSRDELRRMLVERESPRPPDDAYENVKVAYETFLTRVVPRFGHPLQQGLKRTACGDLVGGIPHERPIDGAPECSDPECQ